MRHLWIDSLKGLGIILVIATHTSLPAAFPQLSVMLAAGYIAMFFILSGYTTKEEVFGPAIKKKAMRLLVPYFFYGIATTALFSVTDIVRGSININEWVGLLYSRYAIRPLNSPDNTFLLCTTAPLWFLTAMFMAYCWFYIYANLRSTVSKCVCIVLYITATIILHKIGILLPWSIDTSFLCALFIIVGYEFSPHATTIYKKDFKYFATLFILLGIYLTIVTYNGGANLSVGHYGDQGILSIILYFALSVIITILYSELLKLCNNNGIIRFLAFIGNHSLRLMCMHLPIIIILGPLFKRIGCADKFAIFISAFVISLVASIIIEKIRNRYTDRYPILKYL